MTKSMTGYGRAQSVVDGFDITVEIKSVNHRYFEFSSRVPRVYGFLEEKIKSFLQSRISRGKIDCFVQIEALDDMQAVVKVNKSLADGYYKALKEMSEQYNFPVGFSAVDIARYPDVLSVHKEEADEDKLWNAVSSVLEDAVNNFIAMRENEGKRLEEDILSRAGLILNKVEFIEERSPQTVKEYCEKLLARMQEILGDVHIDEQRILTEAAVYADKIAVAEETVRLRSHISQLHEMFNSKDAIGRKMDFLVQEMNREANTIGSKAQDVDIARNVLDIKAEIEKIREQVQNIE